MTEVAYVSKVSIEGKKGPVRHAHLPALEGPVVFGVHGLIADHYGFRRQDFEPHATTLDYVVAAAAG